MLKEEGDAWFHRKAGFITILYAINKRTKVLHGLTAKHVVSRYYMLKDEADARFNCKASCVMILYAKGQRCCMVSPQSLLCRHGLIC